MKTGKQMKRGFSPRTARIGGLWIAGIALALPVAQADTVNLADGGTLDGNLSAVTTGEVVVSVGRDTRRLPLAGVVSVAFGANPGGALMAQAGRCVAVAEDGTRLGIENPAIADGELRGKTSLGEIVIPLQAIAYLLCPGSHERPMDVEPLAARLGLKRGDQDVVVVSSGDGQAVAVSGVLLRRGGGHVVIEYDGMESPLPADSVRLIQMAKTAGAANLAAAATMVCADGSMIAIESLRAAGSGFQMKSPALGTLTAARGNVSCVRFRGEQVVLLADLTPQARQTGFFDESFPWKKNRAVSGGPLQMNGRTYENGIGVHARCALTYTLGGAYRSFSAVAGIDDSVRAGSATLAVEADGRPLFGAVRLESGKAPQSVRVDVKGVERMTVVMGFVEGTFGGGARVDLCDAVLVK